MISIPNTDLKFRDEPDRVIYHGYPVIMHLGEQKLIEYPARPGLVELWILTVRGWAIHTTTRGASPCP